MLVIRRVKIRDVVCVSVIFVCLCAVHNLVTTTTTTPSHPTTLTLTPPSPPSTSSPTLAEEEYLVKVSEDVTTQEVASRLLPLVTSFVGAGEYKYLPPPTTRHLQKYSSVLSVHLQRQATGRPGKGGNTVTGTKTSAANTTASVQGFSVRIHPSSSPPPPLNSSSTSYTSSSASIRDLVKELVALVEGVELPCARLLRQGGRSCQRLPDGDKKVCTDLAVAPGWSSCLVYSFGLGHDFTFDVAMAQLGCEVFVFDDDNLHDMYPSHPFPRVHLGHVRLGAREMYQVVEDKVRNSTYAYVYRSLDNLMDALGHSSAHLDFLKVDIEGEEWEVFGESIFKTDILERTRQLAIEIHMTDFLKPNITSEETVTALLKYISFFKGLRDRGFRLAHHEPNYMRPTFTTVQGVTFSILAEQLWINTHTHPPPRPRPQPHPRHSHARYTLNPHAQAIRFIELVGQYEFE